MTALVRREVARIREVNLVRAVGTGVFLAYGLYCAGACPGRLP